MAAVQSVNAARMALRRVSEPALRLDKLSKPCTQTKI
ncbi:hypothetical protein ACNKHW_17620 [Shigella flexneri]